MDNLSQNQTGGGGAVVRNQFATEPFKSHTLCGVAIKYTCKYLCFN